MTTAQNTSSELANSTSFSLYATRDDHGSLDLNFAPIPKITHIEEAQA